MRAHQLGRRGKAPHRSNVRIENQNEANWSTRVNKTMELHITKKTLYSANGQWSDNAPRCEQSWKCCFPGIFYLNATEDVGHQNKTTNQGRARHGLQEESQRKGHRFPRRMEKGDRWCMGGRVQVRALWLQKQVWELLPPDLRCTPGTSFESRKQNALVNFAQMPICHLALLDLGGMKFLFSSLCPCCLDQVMTFPSPSKQGVFFDLCLGTGGRPWVLRSRRPHIVFGLPVPGPSSRPVRGPSFAQSCISENCFTSLPTDSSVTESFRVFSDSQRSCVRLGPQDFVQLTSWTLPLLVVILLVLFQLGFLYYLFVKTEHCVS